MKPVLFILIFLFFLSCTKDRIIDPIEENDDDYFPMSLNDTLHFDYKHIDHYWNDKKILTGNRKWIIEGISNIGDTILYSIQTVTSGELMYIKSHDYPYSDDTSYSEYFNIDSFKITEYHDSISWYGVTMPRKYSTSEPEYIFTYNEDWLTIKLRRYFGLDYLYFRNAGGNSWDEGEYKRIYK